MMTELTLYDGILDLKRPATQRDIDHMQAHIQRLGRLLGAVRDAMEECEAQRVELAKRFP